MRRVRTIARGDRSLERQRCTLLLQRLLYYCNDFCAEAETIESPSLIPSLTEDVSARTEAMTSRAAVPPARRDRRPGDGLIDSRRSARAFFQAARRA